MQSPLRYVPFALEEFPPENFTQPPSRQPEFQLVILNFFSGTVGSVIVFVVSD
jgi:hypothetical protein